MRRLICAFVVRIWPNYCEISHPSKQKLDLNSCCINLYHNTTQQNTSSRIIPRNFSSLPLPKRFDTSLMTELKILVLIKDESGFVQERNSSWTTFQVSLNSVYSHEPRHEKICFCHMRTTKAQISLRIRAV